jgi:hypothetical protein
MAANRRTRDGALVRLVGLVALVTAATPSTDNAQVLMQRDVSLHMALTIAETAIAECEKTGNDVSVAVVDSRRPAARLATGR